MDETIPSTTVSTFRVRDRYVQGQKEPLKLWGEGLSKADAKTLCTKVLNGKKSKTARIEDETIPLPDTSPIVSIARAAKPAKVITPLDKQLEAMRATAKAASAAGASAANQRHVITTARAQREAELRAQAAQIESELAALRDGLEPEIESAPAFEPMRLYESGIDDLPGPSEAELCMFRPLKKGKDGAPDVLGESCGLPATRVLTETAENEVARSRGKSPTDTAFARMTCCYDHARDVIRNLEYAKLPPVDNIDLNPPLDEIDELDQVDPETVPDVKDLLAGGGDIPSAEDVKRARDITPPTVGVVAEATATPEKGAVEERW